MVCVLLDIWAVVLYMTCSICGLLNGMCAVVGYVDSCMLCGRLNVIWAVVGYVGSCVVCGLLYGIWAVA